MVRPDVEPEYTYILRDEYQDNAGKGNKGDTSTWKVTAALLVVMLLAICLTPESKESISSIDNRNSVMA